jgi:conjugal transfer pilus assembly protein TraD
MAHGVDALLDRALVRLMDAHPPARGWMKRVRQGEKTIRPGEEVSMQRLRMLWYQKEGSLDHSEPAIDGGIKVATQSREYYSKITQSLLPLLEKLCGGQLGAMLSPDYEDLSDPRPIWDFEHVIDHGQVLYIGLNALSDIQTARSLGSLALSDLSSLIGNRYNLGKNGERISLFVDELSNVVNPSLIEILNKGAEGGVYSTCAMQTIADLEVELHGESGARKVVGNLNNKIILRSVDNTTCQFAVEAIGTALVKQADSASSTSSGGDALGIDLSGGDALRVTLTEKDLIPSHVIGKLPTAEFFALCGAQRVWKGRVPILTDPEPSADGNAPKANQPKGDSERIERNKRFAEWFAPIKKYLPLIAKPRPGETQAEAEERCTAKLFRDWVSHEKKNHSNQRGTNETK